MNKKTSTHSLSRELNTTLLLLYGLGNILGAGIYVLIGKVAGSAGYLSVFSFALACFIAFFTALSYIELASRYPVSAGEAVYIQKGIGSVTLSMLTGWFIIFAGLISASAMVHGFIGYLSEFVTINSNLAIFLVISSLVIISIQGIKTSVFSASVLTIIEILGLLMIIYLGFDKITNPQIPYDKFIPNFTFNDLGIIFIGSFLAFYAFIGFEDMVNVAEEVKNPTKSFPIAIFLALLISGIIYILITIVALQTLSIKELFHSQAPFANIYQKITGNDPFIISIIGLFAVINGALIQIIMASRVIYGLAKKGWLPIFLSRISSKKKTPILATLTAGFITLLFSLFFDLTTLASFTSTLILIIFILVNVSLVGIKISDNKQTQQSDITYIPIYIPIVGVVLNILLLMSPWVFD